MSITAGKIISKTIGAVALGMVGYDAYNYGKWQGKTNTKLTTASWLSHVNENAQVLDSNSAVGNKVKTGFNKWFMDHKINASIAGVCGFFSGIVKSLEENVVPFGLAAGALLFKRCDKLCAIGLGLYAARFFFKNMLGLGKPSNFPETV